MKNHGIIAADWQLKAASEKRLRAIMLPMQPQPKAINGVWWWYPEMTALPIYCQGEHWAKVYEKLPYQIGDTVYLQEEWHAGWFGNYTRTKHADLAVEWRPAFTMPIEVAKQTFLVTDVRIQQMRDLNPNGKLFHRFLGWKPTEHNPRAAKVQWLNTWNANFPEYPFNPNLFVTILSLEPK